VDKNGSKGTVRTFAWASFLNDMGSDMIYPVWPLFVTVVLGSNMAVLGLLDGLGEALVSLSQAASGYLSDKFRRRKIFIWLGYLLGSLSRVGYALSTAWQHFLPFRILDRTGKIRSAPRDAIIADVTTEQTRGGSFGLLRAMDNLGAVCGIVICILLFELLGYRNLFLLAAVPSAIGAMLILTKIKERKAEQVKVFKGIVFKDLSGGFKLYLLLSAIFALGSFSYSFLLIYAKEFGFQVAFVPVLYLIYNVAAALFSLPFGKISDKVGRKPVLMLAFFLWGLVCLSFIFTQSYGVVVFAFVLYGMHKGALEPVQRSFVAELVPSEYRASFLGGFRMVTGLCALPASLAAGLFWDRVSMFAPFFISLGLTAAAAVMLIFVKSPASGISKPCWLS